MEEEDLENERKEERKAGNKRGKDQLKKKGNEGKESRRREGRVVTPKKQKGQRREKKAYRGSRKERKMLGFLLKKGHNWGRGDRGKEKTKEARRIQKQHTKKGK